jgi:hypothetical protein
MAAVFGTFGETPDAVHAALRRAGAELGYALDEATTTGDVVVLKKGIRLYSWGSQLCVTLVAAAGGGTTATVHTAETFALTDWGRGERAAKKLLGAAGGAPLSTT